MTATNFPAFFGFIERPDFDGQPLHTTRGDTGGATAWGWTFGTWVGFARLHGLDASWDHFRGMKRDDFLLPTRLAFWNAVLADRLPAGIDVLWSDFQFGSYHASEQLQRVLGVVADNRVGDHTVAAALAQASEDLIERMTAARLEYYQTLDGYARFGGGWDRRARECCVLALALFRESVDAGLQKSVAAASPGGHITVDTGKATG